MTGSDHWAPIADQLKMLGFDVGDVKKIVIGHGHWDHAGQLSDIPNATLYIQREELRGDRVGDQLPREDQAVNTDPGGCNRTPACGYYPADSRADLRQGARTVRP